ncbi:MAG: hypothetical protein EXR69_04210 [Myxococcales bacterium]|nr:hypothetical protein [Myxococcales bacterium]
MLQQNLTPLSRNLLIGSFIIYAIQLASRGLIDAALGWHGFGSGFFPWQPITSFFLTGPDPRSAFAGWLGIFFFVATVQRLLGLRKLGYAMLAIWAGTVVSTLALQPTGLLQFIPYVGYEPLLLALVCLFGFYFGNAQILLMFVLPIQAIWFAWGSGLYALLWLIYQPSNFTWMSVAAWLSAFVFQFVDQGGIRRFRVQRQRAQVERRFAVHEGGRSPRDTPRWDN